MSRTDNVALVPRSIAVAGGRKGNSRQTRQGAEGDLRFVGIGMLLLLDYTL